MRKHSFKFGKGGRFKIPWGTEDYDEITQHCVRYVCTRVVTCMCVHVCMCMYVCMVVCMHACMYVCIYVCTYVGMCMCVHVCRYVYLGHREYLEEFGELWVKKWRGLFMFYHVAFLVLSRFMSFHEIYRHINNHQTMEKWT